MAKKKSKYKEEDKLQMVCEVPPTSGHMPSSGIDPLRESFIRRIKSTWVNGTLIKFCFFDHNQDHGSLSSWTGNEADRNVVRKAFEKWKSWYRPGVRGDRRTSGSPCAVGFMAGNGFWSYLGTDVLGISKDKRTMNFGSDLDVSIEPG